MMNAVGCTSLVLLIASAAPALAEGERSPMFGGGVIAARDVEDTGVIGVNLEATWWWHRVGFAAEWSRRWDISTSEGLNNTLAGGLRLLLVDHLLESLIEPRDVELGLEAHGVIERAWFDDSHQSTAYGVGAALRLRGGGDSFDSTLLAESRLFVRVMFGREHDTFIARTTAPMMEHVTPVSVVVGLGAVWGKGERSYVDRFRLRMGGDR